MASLAQEKYIPHHNYAKMVTFKKKLVPTAAIIAMLDNSLRRNEEFE